MSSRDGDPTMMRSVIIDRLCWFVHAQFTPAFLTGLPERLERYAEYPEFAVVKDNTVRAALFYRPAGTEAQTFFVKRYKCRDWQEKLKHVFVPSKAQAEWRALQRFEQRGIACPQPLAFTEKRSVGVLQDSCLVLEALQSAVPLNEFVESGVFDFRQRRALTQALAQLVARIHRQGIYYRDLHAGNILLRRDGAGVPELYCIDLHRACFPARLFAWMRIKDLAQLGNSLPTTKTDELRFLRSYCREEADLTGDCFEGLQKRIVAKQLRLERRRIASRSKRCLKNSTVFEKKVARQERYHGRRDFGRARTLAALELHRHAQCVAVKQSTKSVLTTHPGPDDAAQPLCVKRYRYLGVLYSLKNLLRKSRARKSWIAANALLVRGVATPLPLAMLEKKRGPFVVESYIVTRWLEGARELHAYVAESVADMQAARKDAVIKQLALTLRRVHAAGVYHADLKSNNILVQEDAAGKPIFSFIDLDRVLFLPQVSFQQRANNLAQINASVSRRMSVKDRLKFFYFYAKGTPVYRARKQYYR
ncbi:MAG: hypothetical protein GY868_05190, partial [Deltaproteobacteria bacterium]|nr:hypothetical protein [Deltaproteobacteria bacterium]